MLQEKITDALAASHERCIAASTNMANRDTHLDESRKVLRAAQEYKPGEIVPQSGIYTITHDPAHADMPHEVTVIKGRRFPTCPHYDLSPGVLDMADCHR
jgi:hypothetical protein